MTAIAYRTADVDGFKIFYREAGAPTAPKLLLLHGFPSAGHMFRDLIPQLADRFHMVAPDLPGFGNSDMPGRGHSFARIAATIDRFTEVVGFDRYAVYVFDYGAPTGFRLAAKHPDRITAIISQNGNAYEEGLSDGWNPIRAYWQDPSEANREALRAFLKPETTIWQYTHGVPDPTTVSPDGYSLDNFYLARPGVADLQLDLFGDYKSNVALYPTLPDLFPHPQAAPPRGLGQERSVLPAAGRGGVQARHSRRGRPLLRHRAFRAGDPRRRDRGGHSRLPSPLTPSAALKETSDIRPSSDSAQNRLARSADDDPVCLLAGSFLPPVRRARSRKSCNVMVLLAIATHRLLASSGRGTGNLTGPEQAPNRRLSGRNR